MSGGAPARTLEIFEHFGSASAPLSLSEIARLVKVPVSSCQLLLRALLDCGYLYSFGVRKRYYPTRRLYDVAARVRTYDPLVDALRPCLEALARGSGETVILGKRQGDSVLYLEVVESISAVRYTAHAGEFKPLHSSAIGKALLAALLPNELDKLLRALPLRRVTPNTLTSISQLKANIQQGRKRGYFVTRGENIADVMAIAGSIVLEGEMLAIAVAGPLQRMEPVLTRHASLLRDTLAPIAKGRAL